MTAAIPALAPLTDQEVSELTQLLSDSGGTSLDYARGLFTAVASSPTSLEPADWLPWVLGPNTKDKTTLRQTIALLIRDAQSIAECLELGHPWLPDSDETLVQFCKGFTRAIQQGAEWQKAPDVFTKVLPIAVRAGYLEADSVQRFVPMGNSVTEWLAAESGLLPERILELYRHFEPARQQQRKRAAASEKVGRNEPCPCGSGKKHKKCCAH